MLGKESTIVIVGAGQGGLQAASSLRDEGYEGRLLLIGDECCSPYQRPPLSKGFLSGDFDAADVILELPEFFVQAEIQHLAGERVTSIDRPTRQLTLASGPAVAYDHLILATGSRNRMLPCQDLDLDGVLSLRTLDDAEALKDRMATAKHVVVVGAGFLGLEVASMAAVRGAEVLIVEATERTMERVVSPEVSQAFRRLHERNGVRFSFSSQVVAIHADAGRVSGVELQDGSRLSADLVLVAIGVVPNTDLAESAGLQVQNGIVVNPVLGTRDVAISAIGDCAAFPYAFDNGQCIRLESVQNAVDQGRCIAERLTGGHGRYDQVPTFWSEQASSRLQIAGVARRDDTAVVRGDPESDKFSVFRYRRGRLVCVESINSPADHMMGRRLLMNKCNPTPLKVAGVSCDLRQLLATA
ncbi:NAD(P)/FAD-dependent oxidoreductase [Vreelandella titanicae]|uniref:FAD-dependent pyridine nucleotide-disulfide oxidoreductase n=1 Tax=Vreelandella titanicae BH1 TaxID=1204738 RepID=L9U7Q0_9GAMM|nr:FAD/NAD(P)-binding oxidoreductase [Halomonas titanicae]ELY20258.1 FAD-dependent pyridine nucleotide-disulfide oxidoreductase [Halomonas titanicae BH1]